MFEAYSGMTRSSKATSQNRSNKIYFYYVDKNSTEISPSLPNFMM